MSSAARWSITAQADPPVADPDNPEPEATEKLKLPDDFVERLTKLALVNYVAYEFLPNNNKYNNLNISALVPGVREKVLVQQQMLPSRTDTNFTTPLQLSGKKFDQPSAFMPRDATVLATNLEASGNYDPVQLETMVPRMNDITNQGPTAAPSISVAFENVPEFKAGIASLKAQQNVRTQIPLGQTSFNKSRTIKAQSEQIEQGPLSIGRYESISQLRDDLIAMGPRPETYERIMGMVGQENEDDAKDALASFFQGMASSLCLLYDMLVNAGMANPIDAEIVEKLMNQHPNLSDDKDGQKTSAVKKDHKVEGLYIPDNNSGLHTVAGAKIEKTAGNNYPAYMTHGPGENRFCPKIRQPVSTYICRYHCLDGIAVDDHQVICGEALWRQHVMDKFSVEHRDADGKWVGGYLEKRFEIHHDDGGHPALLKPGTRHAPIHEDAWSLEKRMSEMRKSEGKDRGYNTSADSKDLYNFDQHDLSKGPKNPQAFEKKKDGIAKLAEVKVAQSMFPPPGSPPDDFDVGPQSDESSPPYEPTDEDMEDMHRSIILDKNRWLFHRRFSEEGDITTEDHEHWFQYGKLYHVGDENSLKQQMEADQFWPNTWFISDNGNAHLISLDSQLSEGNEAPTEDPWLRNAQSFNFKSAKRKKKNKSKGGWLPYHIWKEQQEKDETDEDSESESDSESDAGSESSDSGGFGGGDSGSSGTTTAAKKKKWDPNPWSVCHTTVDKDKNPDKYERCVHDVKGKQADSSWSIQKTSGPDDVSRKPMKELEVVKAWGLDMSSVGGGGDNNNGLGENKNPGPKMKQCSRCGKNAGNDSKQCTCGSNQFKTMYESDVQSATGFVPKPDLRAHSDAKIVYANGIYKAIKSGKTTFGSTKKEALEKLAAGLEDLETGTIDQLSSDILDTREDMQESNRPIQNSKPVMDDMFGQPESGEDMPVNEPLPPPQIMDPTPSTEGVPAEMVPPIPQEIGPNSRGEAVSEFDVGPDEGHISSDHLDAHLSEEWTKNHPEDILDLDRQAISSGAHPD
jgi:hypothetical protein